MTAIKEKIIGAITIMSDSDAQQLWESIQQDFIARRKDWSDIEEVEPTNEEVKIFNDYKRGDEEYQPNMTQKEVLTELGLK